MRDKLLVEVDMFNREPQDGVRALVYLANELSESATVHISDPSEWYEKRSDEYQVRWRFAEDALSSWQVVINADLAVQLTEALRTARVALDETSCANDTLTAAREAIENVWAAFRESMVKTEPELDRFLTPA
jgi:hypothetical protein